MTQRSQLYVTNDGVANPDVDHKRSASGRLQSWSLSCHEALRCSGGKNVQGRGGAGAIELQWARS